jgi:hypothetical protein
MESKTQGTDTSHHEADLDIEEELAGVLTAISVVSKRLARKLTTGSAAGRTHGGRRKSK